MYHNLPSQYIVISNDDKVVRRQLRDLNQPMCLFAETPANRRERLRTYLIANPAAKEVLETTKEVEELDTKETEHETTYSEGSNILKSIRYDIARHSIFKSIERLDFERIKQQNDEESRFMPQHDLIEKIRNIQDDGSYDDDDEVSKFGLKSVTSCCLNISTQLLATSHANGKCKLWNIPSMETKANLIAHKVMSKHVTFHPYCGSQERPVSTSCVNLASCAMDGSVILWNLDQDIPSAYLSPPQLWRVSRVRFYPTGSLLATCCSDKSWRLYDLSTQQEVLHQDGHTDSVHDINFHPDGSLAASASMDNDARVWDLRTGHSIWLLEGHTSGITSVDFSPDGYHIATGGMDNMIKIWNLRKRTLEYNLPAHTNCITKVQYEKENGYFLTSSSFDATLKFWSTQTWAPIKTLGGYDSKIADFDCSRTSELLVTCFSRYVKLWRSSDF